MERLSKPEPGASEKQVIKYLTQGCSDITIHDPKNGFFNHFIDQIDEQISTDFIEKFGKLKTDEDRVVYLWSVKPVHTLKVQSFYKEKSNEVSEARRAAGNKAFQGKKNQEALMLYSQAVMMADHEDGDSLALGYANRSAVLYHMGKLELCLQDVELALQAGYPDKLLFKVHDRRGQCLMKLGQYSRALKAFTLALESLSKADLDEKKLASWKKDLAKKLEECKGKPDVEKDSPAKASSGPHLYEGPSAILPNASAAVSLENSPEAGRYVVVNRDVEAGKILMAEKPYSAVLKLEVGGTHCTHCFHQLIDKAAVPCRWCSGVAFCGPRCRDLALATYHRWECKFFNLLRGSGMSLNSYLALRIITQHGLHFFKKLRHRLQEPPQLPSASSPHRPDDYLSLYHLVGLEEQRTPSDHFKRTLMAAFLLKVLQRAHFFGKWDEDANKPDADLTEDELLIGSLLLRHLQVIQFNAHELSGMAFGDTKENFKKTKSVYLGLAVYPTVSFSNHSCYPAVGRYFDGNKMVIVNLRPLKAGEVLYENYGPVFTHNKLLERQRKLMSRYWFKCQCVACKEDWPTYDTMPDRRTVKCTTCGSGLPQRSHKQSHVKCQECGSSTNVVAALKEAEEAHKFYVAGCKSMDEGKREEAINSFCQYVDSVTQHLVPPLRELHLAVQSLRLLVAARGTIHTVSPVNK
ncbi:SET and MYND domain-containing protein 4-like [Penaeus japonicus]|uniref:SET and MYND domain-containing protein 4-like n=1 Tax=Penaeus japonicus TaxID=27405 RepID=UPI001C70E55C|nr:SET and MYND domain-containing protein 4-like [Penaeus japonicus]